MQKRFCRKTAAVSALMLLFLTGCHETADAPIVALKQNARTENTIAWNKNLTIEEQVLAPEKYRDTFYGDKGNLEVKIDADVILPDAEGFKIKNVTPRDFTREDLEQIKQALPGGSQMEEMEDQTQGADEIHLEAEVDGEKYRLSMSNSSSDLVKWSSLIFSREQMDTLEMNTTIKKLRKEGKTLLKEMGLTDYVLGGEESTIESTVFSDESDVSGTMPEELWENFTLCYTKKVDGIPITYTSQNPDMLMTSKDAYGIAKTDGVYGENMGEYWKEERIQLIYDGKGLLNFFWSQPYSITDGSDEYVFLLPFSEIHQIFESVIMANYGEPEINTSISVHQIRLGYMRVLDKENLQAAKLVPVWDFFGTVQRSIFYQDGNTGYIEDQGDPYYSLVTINAMDGTIIDRSFGY